MKLRRGRNNLDPSVSFGVGYNEDIKHVFRLVTLTILNMKFVVFTMLKLSVSSLRVVTPCGIVKRHWKMDIGVLEISIYSDENPITIFHPWIFRIYGTTQKTALRTLFRILNLLFYFPFINCHYRSRHIFILILWSRESNLISFQVCPSLSYFL
jgi:hypothetical protein